MERTATDARQHRRGAAKLSVDGGICVDATCMSVVALPQGQTAQYIPFSSACSNFRTSSRIASPGSVLKDLWAKVLRARWSVMKWDTKSPASPWPSSTQSMRVPVDLCSFIRILSWFRLRGLYGAYLCRHLVSTRTLANFHTAARTPSCWSPRSTEQRGSTCSRPLRPWLQHHSGQCC